MKDNEPTISIFFHNYYGQHEKWVKFFCEKINVPFNLFYNLVDNSIYNHVEDYRLSCQLHSIISGQYLNKIILRKSPNQGKDIGGKLVMLDAYLHLQVESDYIIFLHDKKSFYKIQNLEWQKKLFLIIEPQFIEKALIFFNKNKKTGIIANEDSIHNEYDHSMQSFISNNRLQLVQLQSEFTITTAGYSFVAGSMFWARSFPLLTFFRKHPPLEIRKNLEIGNSMDVNEGTITHAWERLLSWLITAQGYKIKGM